MRFFIFLFLIVCLSFSCNNGQVDTPVKEEKMVEEIKAGDRIRDIIRNPVSKDQDMDTTNLAKIVFEERRFDFGTVNEGDVVRHEYKFTNEGKAPLLIANAKSTCGCTVPEWPKEPIPPGGKGVIKVRFDTKNKTERQGKPIIITANTYPRETNLQLKGFVTPQKK